MSILTDRNRIQWSDRCHGCLLVRWATPTSCWVVNVSTFPVPHAIVISPPVNRLSTVQTTRFSSVPDFWTNLGWNCTTTVTPQGLHVRVTCLSCSQKQVGAAVLSTNKTQALAGHGWVGLQHCPYRSSWRQADQGGATESFAGLSPSSSIFIPKTFSKLSPSCLL